MSKDGIAKNIQNIKADIEKIYAEFSSEMTKLEKEQAAVIGDFQAELEKAKIEDIKNNIDKKQ